MLEPLPNQQKQIHNAAILPSYIFKGDTRQATVEFKLPEPDERLNSTLQLACCLSLLQNFRSTDETMEPAARKWLQVVEKDTDEQERLHTMATEVIRVFKRDELKDARAIAEVVCLSPVLSKDAFHDLLREFYSGIDHSGLLNVHQLEGLAQLIQGTDPGHLGADDLVKILNLLSKRLRDTHQQSISNTYRLTLAVSHVLDAMADIRATGLDRETLHEPLSNYLRVLRESSDPYLVYQAAYAYQALLCVPDNETAWQAAVRRTGKVIQGVSGVVSGVKGLDLIKFTDGLDNIHHGLSGAFRAAGLIKATYDGAAALVASGQCFGDCLNERFSFERKRDWYSALRGADVLIRDRDLAMFKKLVCEAPCRLDPAFQWGVCQRLGEIAANPVWDVETHRGAVAFLGEIYRNDTAWGQQPNVKQWILNILMQLASASVKSAETLLLELKTDRDSKKQALYRACRVNGPVSYPLGITLPDLASPSLLDRVQNRPDVEGNLRVLKKQRTKERGTTIYIPPQAKASFQATDDSRFSLMEMIKGFLESEQKVFLLLGDSGAGKSTFGRELVFELWQTYKTKTGRIPLFINLPSIDKPEHDMIAKQFRKEGFTESQIRELKLHRKIIVICDGYDESQQTHNLYSSNRLNQPGEWDAQMIVSCRSEYLGFDYRDRFQPADRNQISSSSLFQEAVMTPFSLDQVQAYIDQYVSVNQPLWQTDDYKRALELIPTLKELVRNPFLMALSLEVLPRMVDLRQDLAVTRVTRVGLYDHFVEQWLERSKKRLGEKDMTPQARADFERLSEEGFTQNGIDYLKRLAVAIYKRQDGQPVVEYSRFKDEGSWKDEFFGREDKQLLREACPLTRNGNQYRFIHRTLLEYGLARAVFDPQDERKTSVPGPAMDRRRSIASTLSFEIENVSDDEVLPPVQKPSFKSPLVWRCFVNDHSLLQFLEERVKQEPEFKDQLLSYIEHSKTNKKWHKAAANAMTILVRSGVQFNNTDLRGIRIPGADLSYSSFDSAQLQGADLRKVNFRGAWLRQADLSKAQMTGIQFGEQAYLKEECAVHACAYSPDGKTFAASLDSGEIAIYTTSNWKRIFSLIGHTGVAVSVQYSPKGGQIASCGQDNTVRLWQLNDSGTGSLQHTLTGHTNWVDCVAYSPQENQVASASHDGTIQLWDTVNGVHQRTLVGHTMGVHCVVFSPTRNQLASGSSGPTIRLWDTKTGECTGTLVGHKDRVWAIAYSPQGYHIASASEDTTVRLWDVETGNCYRELSGHGSSVYSVTYSPKGDQVAIGSQDGVVQLWDVETGLCRHSMTGHSEPIMSVVYSPKGDQIASGSGDSTVRLWDISAGASRSVSNGHSMGIMSVKQSPTGGYVASCSKDGSMRFWDVETGAISRTLNDQTGTVCSIALSPQGNRIATGGADHTLKVWDVETGTRLQTMTGHSNWVNGIVFSPRGDRLASASEDWMVRLWNVASGECLMALSGHEEAVMSVAFSPDGRTIASGGLDNTIRMWDTETGSCYRILTDHSDWIWEVVYSPQGDQFATASSDGTLKLWDAGSGQCTLTLTGHSGNVLCVVYSPQGHLLASGSEDKSMRIWDVATGQCRAVVQNFQGGVRSVSWSTVGNTNYVTTGGRDGSVLMWHVVEEEDQFSVQLRWTATSGVLTMTGSSIQDVRGLTELNRQLLKQRGANGEPEHLLHNRTKGEHRGINGVEAEEPVGCGIVFTLGLLFSRVISMVQW